MEMGDVMTADVSSIQLQRSPYGYRYSFKDDDGEGYVVHFEKDRTYIPNIRLYVDGFSIEFSGPEGLDLTNKYKAANVYRQLMMAVKKLIEQFHPNSLSFSGAEDAQTIMYDTFYRKFLKTAYTRISKYGYLSNDYIEQMKTANPQDYERLKQTIADNDETVNKYIKSLRQDKVAGRDERKQIFARGQALAARAVGKLAWGEGAKLICIKDVQGDTVSAYRFDTLSNKALLQRFIASSIKPFNQQPMGFPTERIMGWVDNFVNDLRSKGIAVQGYYEG